uniref:DNA 5'-3' helicase n=1 Tax=Dicranema revolutum TaxID=239144 RepID=A0A4D6WRT3_9FLOR|nr:replication helicase subunit [Dicranema revolutum]
MNKLYTHSIQPQNYLAEEIIIGHIIINPYSLHNILYILKIEHFFLESHRIIYKNLLNSYSKHKYNILEIIHLLKIQNVLTKIGNIEKIINLIKQSHIFISSINQKFYITQLMKIIDETYKKRLIIQYAYNFINLAYDNKISVEQLYLKLSQQLQYISSDHVNNIITNNQQDVILDLIAHSYDRNKKSIKFNSSISSGFKDLDDIIHSFSRGDLVVIAGRPSMGKTSLAINIAYNTLRKKDIQICIFSLEMTKIQILHKLISIGSQISAYDIMQGKINKYQWNIIQNICQELLISKIYINDSANISIEEINDIAENISKNNNIFIIIDYLQLIQAQELKYDNRVEELSYITRQLKILAQKLKIPIIILSQLNRNIETRSNKKPLLSDLKESGCLPCKFFITTNNNQNISLQHRSQYRLPYLKYKSKIDHCNRNIFNYNLSESITFFIEITFCCVLYYKKKILLTETHPVLTDKSWSIQFILQENESITNCNKSHNLTDTIEKRNLIIILISKNYLVYEVNRNDYSILFHRIFILHNSIEQDADIVIMLYTEELIQKDLIKDKKIIDLLISKNRNGSIGSLKLLFNLPNTAFTNMSIL